MLTTEEMELLLPEMTLIAGIIFAILIPNLGDSTLRIPLTRTRIPILIGGLDSRYLRPQTSCSNCNSGSIRSICLFILGN